MANGKTPLKQFKIIITEIKLHFKFVMYIHCMSMSTSITLCNVRTM